MSNFCLSFVSEMSRNRYNRHPVWPPIWGKRHSCRFSSSGKRHSCRFSSSGKRHSCRFPHWLSHRLKRQECRFPGGARRPAEPPRKGRAVNSDGDGTPSAPQPPVAARGACCPHNDVHSLQTVNICLTTSHIDTLTGEPAITLSPHLSSVC